MLENISILPTCLPGKPTGWYNHDRISVLVFGGVKLFTCNRSTIIYLLLFVVIIIMVVYNFQSQATSKEVLPINKVAADVKSGQIERILENDNELRLNLHRWH